MNDLKLALLSGGALLGCLAAVSLWVATDAEDKHFRPRDQIGRHDLGYHLNRAAYKAAPRSYSTLNRIFLYVAAFALTVGAALCFVALLRAE